MQQTGQFGAAGQSGPRQSLQQHSDAGVHRATLRSLIRTCSGTTRRHERGLAHKLAGAVPDLLGAGEVEDGACREEA